MRLLILWYSVGISVRHIQKGIRTWHHPLRLCCYNVHPVGKDLEHTASLKRDCYRKVKTFGTLILIPPANEVCEELCFYRCLFVHGGACVAGGACMVGACVAGVCMAEGHVWWGVCVAGGVHGWGHAWQILRDTVNERAARILLECILVCHEFQYI